MAKKQLNKDADIDKTIKNLGEGVQEEMDAMDEAGLRDAIVTAEAILRETEAELKANDKLTAAKELVKDLGGAYAEVKKAQKSKTKYALFLLDQKGLLA